ncbi:MAG: polysaccharide biosynthesis PFTS motif protein [Candidatus Omnitrophica bacterium]|nr:polysaccharide biosynthesis PFTS motif protein [Candidatus Omnitrophota bacterium]
MSRKIVLESFFKLNEKTVEAYLKDASLVYAMEPFACHHKKGGKIAEFPSSLPSHIDQLVQEGKILFISTKDIESKTIHGIAMDKAVEVVEAVYPAYYRKHKLLIDFVCDVLKDREAENAFKKLLCERLGEFYAQNIVVERVSKYLNFDPIIFYPEVNIADYNEIRELLLLSRQDFFHHDNLEFSKESYHQDFRKNMGKIIGTSVLLLLQTLASLFLGLFFPKVSAKKSYRFGVALISSRQLEDNKRGPAFFADGKSIQVKDVVCFSSSQFSKAQRIKLAQQPFHMVYLPRPGQLFCHFHVWWRLLNIFWKNYIEQNKGEFQHAMAILFVYFRWKNALEKIEIKHFVTHCDFGFHHIARNCALKQAGIETWYFTDSINMGCNFRTESKSCLMRHPFWTYLFYDHFVTWNEFVRDFFCSHPHHLKETHIVGCLWSQYETVQCLDGMNKDEQHFVIGAFDTTYSLNGLVNYSEGTMFAEHLLRLVESDSRIFLFLKEKKGREFLSLFDPGGGGDLLRLYQKMSDHPRIKIFLNFSDATEVINFADMIISFPFTSTTFEALSFNKPAVWHDPQGLYKEMIYSQTPGVVTHSYEELKKKVEEVRSGLWQNPFPLNSPLMDPFRDGKAIERFRKLLTSS